MNKELLISKTKNTNTELASKESVVMDRSMFTDCVSVQTVPSNLITTRTVDEHN